MTSGFLNSDMERLVKAMVLPGRWHGFETGESSALAGQSLEISKDGCWLAFVVRARVWWWPGGSWGGTTRRDSVDRLAATLIFAGWDRRSAKRRKVPLTTVAWHGPWHRVHGGRSCSGGVPARRTDVRTSSADLETVAIK
jgi:hypothetical protein